MISFFNYAIILSIALCSTNNDVHCTQNKNFAFSATITNYDNVPYECAISCDCKGLKDYWTKFTVQPSYTHTMNFTCMTGCISIRQKLAGRTLWGATYDVYEGKTYFIQNKKVTYAGGGRVPKPIRK